MANLWQTGQIENDTDGLLHSPAHLRLECVFTDAHWGWDLECGDWKANPGEELQLAARRQPEGTGGRKSENGNTCGRNPDCHRSKVQLLSDMQGVEQRLKPLSPHVLAPAQPGAKKSPHQGWPSYASCQALGKAPTRAGSHMPLAASFPTHLLPRGPLWPRQSYVLSSPGQTQVLQAALGADSSGWPTDRGGAKTTAEPQV